MTLIYTHPNHFAVVQVRDLLAAAGIECELRNEFALGAMGELAPIDVWPELWLYESADYDRAQRLIEAQAAAAEGADWFCRQCGERNAASFDFCWACGQEQE